MTNADKFQQVFGIYATELWAKPEKEFLEWLNASAEPERKKGQWKVVPYKSVQHGEVVIDGETVRCSECRHAGKGWHLGMRFCPNCGSYNGGDENRENSHTVKEWF